MKHIADSDRQSQLPVFILGAGGHARVVFDVLKSCSVVVKGFVAPKKATEIAGRVAPFIEDEAVILDQDPSQVLLANAAGFLGETSRRKDLFMRYKERGYSFVTVVHPSAVISGDVELEEGCQVMAGAVVQTGSRIGANTIINTRASVDHDSLVGAHCHISPGATVCGGVTIGEHSHVGAGSTVIQKIKIGSNVLVGAGAVVVRNVESGVKVLGVPARPYR